MVFQILLSCFALFAIIKTWRQFLHKEVSKYWAALFTLLWVMVIVVALIPNLTNVIASFVGIGRGADVVIYSAIVILTYGVYRVMMREQRLAKEMTDLVRAVAIDRAHQPTTSTHSTPSSSPISGGVSPSNGGFTTPGTVSPPVEEGLGEV